jgi:hypothetical protein
MLVAGRYPDRRVVYNLGVECQRLPNNMLSDYSRQSNNFTVPECK